jgi:hypothetical protein
MPIPTWPATLPIYSLKDGHSVSSDAEETVTSDMEDGLPITRPKRLFTLTPVSLSFRLTPAQWVVLRDFWRITLVHGASPFNMPVYDFAGGVVTKKVHWSGGAPTPAKLGALLVRASFSVKVENFYGP